VFHTPQFKERRKRRLGHFVSFFFINGASKRNRMLLHLSHGLLCTCLPDVTDLNSHARRYVTAFYNEFECYLKDKYYATASFTCKST